VASNGILPAVQFARALEAAGVVSDLDSITRIVIDVGPRHVVRVYVERVAGPELDQVAGLLGEMMHDGRAADPDAPRGTRYWVLVSRELLDNPAWAQAGLRKIELGGWESCQGRWVLFEDPAAPADLEGLEVDLTFEQYGDGPVRIASRSPAPGYAARGSGAELRQMTPGVT
jgi:hypothetical protein